MTLYYKYIVISERTSREVVGTTFGNRRQIYNEFVEKGFTVVSIHVDVQETLRMLFRRKRFSDLELSIFFEDFANMLDAGLTINHIFMALKEMSIRPTQIEMYKLMLKNLEKGETLVKTFERVGIFPPIALMVLAGGERAGNLPEVMRVLAVYFKEISEMRSQVIRSLIYPVLVIVILLGTTVYVSTNLVPKLKDLLPAQAMEGPLTLFMMGLSVVVKDYWLLTIVLVAGAIVAACWVYKNYTTQFNRFLFRIPYLGDLMRDQEISICFLALYILLKSGINLDQAMRQTISGGNNYTTFHLEKCREKLVYGANISDAFLDEPYFPRWVAETLRCGEETGKYFEYFERVYKFYNKVFLMRMNALVASVQPLSFLFVGGFICLYAFAFLSPIYSNLGNLGALPK